MLFRSHHGGVRQSGATPLYIAARAGHVELVERLLEAGADIDAKFKAGAGVDQAKHVSGGARLRLALAPGQRLVTAAGDLWRWDGLSVRADAQTATAKRLAGRNRLAELEGQIAEARTEVTTLRAAHEAARRREGEATAAEREARESLKRSQRAEAEGRERLARVVQEADRLTHRLAALDDALARLDEETAIAEARAEETAAAFDDLPDTAALDHDILTAQIGRAHV